MPIVLSACHPRRCAASPSLFGHHAGLGTGIAKEEILIKDNDAINPKDKVAEVRWSFKIVFSLMHGLYVPTPVTIDSSFGAVQLADIGRTGPGQWWYFYDDSEQFNSLKIGVRVRASYQGQRPNNEQFDFYQTARKFDIATGVQLEMHDPDCSPEDCPWYRGERTVDCGSSAPIQH